MRIMAAVLLLATLTCCMNEDFLFGIPWTQVPGDVVLSPGGVLRLPDQGYVLTCKRITQDSRCPVGAECFWAGDAGVWLNIEGTEAKDCTLHTTLEPKAVTLQRLGIALKYVLPYPELSTRIDSLDYRVTLTLSEPQNSRRGETAR